MGVAQAQDYHGLRSEIRTVVSQPFVTFKHVYSALKLNKVASIHDGIHLVHMSMTIDSFHGPFDK